MTRSLTSTLGRRQGILLGVVAVGTMALAACGSSSSSSTSTDTASAGASATGAASADAGAGGKVAVSLIVKTNDNPFFVAMQKGAKEDAAKDGVELTLAAGKKEGDNDSQIAAINAAIANKQKGILITPMSTAVNPAIEKARAAGLFVIALDTPPDPPTTVDITFATDNLLAGKLIGQYAAAKLAGAKAVIGLLDLFDNQVVSVDYNRDQGFLQGLGIPVNDPKKNGDEAKTGKYTGIGGKGGDYEIVGNAASQGDSADGKAAMQKLLAKNPNINVVYTINEPAAEGAASALKAAGKTIGKDVFIVSVDGGKAGVQDVAAGTIAATSQQYPLKMASLGVAAIAAFAKDGTKPSVSAGLDFYNTGVTLIAKDALPGVDSKDPAYGLTNAWG
jgi:fructose transport system substrate-binding protein